MAGRTYGFAIVGGGVIGPTHARSIAALPNAALRAVVDVVPERAERLAREFGAQPYTDLDAALARPDVDVVCACVPSGLHAEVGARAAAAGKHVVVEKPIDVTLEAADRLIAACRAHRVKLAVISQRRFDPGVRRLRAALDAGRFGRLVLGDAIIKWYRTQQYYDSGDWRGTWALDGGGALMNQGIHYIDLLQWLMGPVERVVARRATAAHDIAVEDVAVALVTFANGALGVIEGSTAVYPGLPERLAISGAGGTAVIEAGEVTVWEFKDERGEVGAYGAKVRPGAPPPAAGTAADPAALEIAGHRAQLADLLAAIEEDRDPAVTGEEARKPLALILAIYESARTGREVVIAPAPPSPNA
ncbi:MAG TPA: Gfo/Idh/MocA family oxidoreductase [Thermomicrobiales bacterium]|nr:Gfo/Idh/MocA family oxidoreductase [Thermomicrobiales bacterium]